jgi:hypothetical protein
VIKPPYQGTVDIDLRSRGRVVSIKIRDIAVSCEDGTEPVSDFKFRANVRKNGTFRRQQILSYAPSGQSFTEIAGQVSTNKVQGTFYFLSDSYQPDQQPDCATPGPVPWKATPQ